MAEDSKVEIEEIIEDLDYSTPSGSRSSSLDRGSYLQSSFQDPTSNPDRLQWMEAVDSFAPISRSDLRSSTELAEDSVLRPIAVTPYNNLYSGVSVIYCHCQIQLLSKTSRRVS